MKKLLLICCIALAAAVAFADDAAAPAPAPAKNFEVYGATQFDYAMSGAEMSMATPIWSNFTFAKLRFGLRDQLVDNVKVYAEFDPRNLEFRLAYLDWTVAPNFVLSAGKYNTLFAQVDSWIYGSRKTGVGAKYTLPGIGWAGVQVMNDADVAFVSGAKLSFPGTTAVSLAPSVANPTDIKVNPAIAFKPDLGKDISLEVGANSEMNVTKMAATTSTGLSIDGYLKAAAYGISLSAEYTFANINDATVGNQLQTLFAQVAYDAKFVVPTAYIIWDNIPGTSTKSGYNTTPNLTLAFEVPFSVTKDLKINPMFSYALSGANVNEWLSQGSATKANDWTAGIRFDYSFSQKF